MNKTLIANCCFTLVFVWRPWLWAVEAELLHDLSLCDLGPKTNLRRSFHNHGEASTWHGHSRKIGPPKIRLVGWQRFLKLPVLDDNCVTNPISSLLSSKGLLRDCENSFVSSSSVILIIAFSQSVYRHLHHLHYLQSICKPTAGNQRLNTLWSQK